MRNPRYGTENVTPVYVVFCRPARQTLQDVCAGPRSHVLSRRFRPLVTNTLTRNASQPGFSGSAPTASRPVLQRSEQEFETKLDVSGILCRQDMPKRGGSQEDVGKVEVRMVEQIENLEPKFQVQVFADV